VARQSQRREAKRGDGSDIFFGVVGSLEGAACDRSDSASLPLHPTTSTALSAQMRTTRGAAVVDAAADVFGERRCFGHVADSDDNSSAAALPRRCNCCVATAGAAGCINLRRPREASSRGGSANDATAPQT